MDQQPPERQRPFIEITWDDIKGRARELAVFMPHFLKNPIEGIKRVPSWDWPTVILLEILVAAITGFFGGIVAHHILAIIGGLIVGPVMGLLISFVLAGLVYYSCLFLMKTELEFRRVFIVVVLAKVYAQILGMFAPLAKAPVNLFCIVLTALLLTVGLVENFMLEKRKTAKIVGAIAGLALIMWIYATILDVTSNRIKVQDYTPESLDQIHKELSDGK